MRVDSNGFRFLAVLALLLNLTLARAQEGTIGPEPDFEIQGFDTSIAGGTGDLDLADGSFVGNPLNRLAEKWPADLVIAPVPGYSPQLGWNLKLAGGYFLSSAANDARDRPSLLGGFVMGAENGSYAYGGGADFHLYQDALRIKLGAAYADIRYRFYGIGNEANDRDIGLDIVQEGPLYFATASWRVWKDLYLGVGYLGGNVDSSLRVVIPGIDALAPTLNLDVGAYTIPIQVDSRDHQQFPRRGWLVTVRGSLYRESAGSDFDAEIFKVSVNRYLPMREQDVLALRMLAKTASDEAPFFLLSSFGGSTDLRGYPAGRYRDRVMYALQGEYRWWLNNRWILTGFAGFGEVAPSFSRIGENFLPAGGIGARFVLSQKHRVSLSADLAVGEDGAEFYFGVGEAF